VDVLLDKIREPSTWAGLGLVVTAFGWNAELWHQFVQAATAVAGLLAIILRERNGH
jgi:hypothetical protein